MHPISTAFVLLAVVCTCSPVVPIAATQQPALDLSRDRTLRDAVTDVRRLGLVTEVAELRPGTLALTIGPAFTSSTSTSYNLGRLYLAYAEYQRAHEGPIVLELLDADGKIGEYTKGGLRLTRQPPAPTSVPVPVSPAGQSSTTTSGPRRGGSAWYAGLGVGSGAADFTCDGCTFERSPAISGYLMLGRQLGQRTVLGVEATGWTKSDEISRGRLYTVTAVALGYFDENLPLFLSGGVGYAGYRRRLPTGTVAANAVGYSARLGARIHLVRQLHLGPYIGLAGSFGQPEFTYADGTPYGLSANFSNLQFGATLIIN